MRGFLLGRSQTDQTDRNWTSQTDQNQTDWTHWTDPTDLDRPTSSDLVARVARRVAPSRPESLEVARPSRFEREKSTEKAARVAPRGDFRGIRVDFRSDFRVFFSTARANVRPRKNTGFSRPNPLRTRFLHFHVFCKNRTENRSKISSTTVPERRAR